MKKIFILLVFCLLGTITTFAQNDNKTGRWQGEVDAGVYYIADGHRGGNFMFTANCGYLFKERFLVGIGTGISYSTESAMGGNDNKTRIPVYADIKYYLPMGKKTSFLVILDAGYSMNTEKRVVSYINGAQFKTGDNGSFLISPQLGLSFKTGQCTSLNFTLGYRYEFTNQVGVKLGFAF